ncbi:MAG: PAS domain-containing protein [Rhodospirillaceae bacterium]|nr:PAS domain-containing protein [Rhodospirillaceae bacterium]
MSRNVHVTGKERYFGDDDIIVSKTDLKGRITYANRLFMSLADLSEENCLDEPHSLVRHPDMPRTIFHLLWDTVQAGREIFAYVKNRSVNGDHYWVYAHVTPSFDKQNRVIGYHSTRRNPNRDILQSKVMPLYAKILQVEHSVSDRKDGMQRGIAMFNDVLKTEGKAYDEFILTL